jgi:hypothetical protein
MQIDTESFSVGDRVRITESVTVYHHPDYRNQPHDLKGQEGEVVEVIKSWEGKPVSANFPYLVKIGAKFRAHLQARELEKID